MTITEVEAMVEGVAEDGATAAAVTDGKNNWISEIIDHRRERVVVYLF